MRTSQTSKCNFCALFLAYKQVAISETDPRLSYCFDDRVMGQASDDIKLTSGSVIEISRLPGYTLQTKGEIKR